MDSSVGHQAVVRTALAWVESERVIDRIWELDATLWPEPSAGAAAAGDRLGWLTLPDTLTDLTSTAKPFATEAGKAGLRDVVLLGMGGSSLAPEVMRSVLDGSPSGLNLHVLDSTVPAQIAAVQKRLDVTRTLFLVSSKSGTTVEPLSLYRYFTDVLQREGIDSPASRFVAITDPGTPLEDLARTQGFRRVFRGQPDVGGRFSALSPFGVVPAALTAASLGALTEACRALARACRLPAAENPGARLGAFLGGLAAQGRDKVTLITSPELRRLGLWIEQLLAESTGKTGKGLIPVSDEPSFDPTAYGPDRQFVCVRLAGDNNAALDARVAALGRAGLPVEHVEMADKNSLWAEFYRWEIAVTVASALISVYPFDEPDVNLAKDSARAALRRTGTPGQGAGAGLAAKDAYRQLLANAQDGDYLAIGAYLPESDDLTDAFGTLRSAVTRRHGIATTFGYGPRYLHSTGQLHKGGPDSVLVLLLVAGDAARLPIPGESHGFDSLAAAQAEGDLAALHSLGRRAAVGELTGDYVAGVASMAESVAG